MTADLVLKNGWIVTPQATVKGGVAIADGKFGTPRTTVLALMMVPIGFCSSFAISVAL